MYVDQKVMGSDSDSDTIIIQCQYVQSVHRYQVSVVSLGALVLGWHC